MVAQFAHPVPGVQPRAPEPGFIGAIQKAQVPELFPGGARDLLRLLIEHLGCHLITAQFVRQVQKLLQKGRFLRGAPVDRQGRCYLAQRLLHGQKLAACVQRHLGESTGQRQHPLPQTAEAQHLRMAADCGAADAAKIDLRQMGDVFRYQQDLLSMIAQRSDLLQYCGTLSCFCPSHPNRQHGPTPFLRFLFSAIISHFSAGEQCALPFVRQCAMLEKSRT